MHRRVRRGPELTSPPGRECGHVWYGGGGGGGGSGAGSHTARHQTHQVTHIPCAWGPLVWLPGGKDGGGGMARFQCFGGRLGG